jgi:dihydroxyacid dehydratase/phosphogluconate dehydratase
MASALNSVVADATASIAARDLDARTPPAHRVVEAPARVFADQYAPFATNKRGARDDDAVAVARFQESRADGMSELHKLTPSLRALPNDAGSRNGYGRQLFALMRANVSGAELGALSLLETHPG